MKIVLITPAPGRSRAGNRVTALRWARILKSLGHRVAIARRYRGQPCDLMVALHALRSFDSIERFRRLHPERPLIVALTGTDLYRDIRENGKAQRSLELATRLVVLQPEGIRELARHVRGKTRVIYQSAKPFNGLPGRPKRSFAVSVLSHLRPVKDPLRAARAARLLPARSRILVFHAGKALSKEMGKQARAEERANPRYRWLGELPHWRARRLLARSHLMVLSSITEGGANVLSEALAASVPVLASRIPGSIGILGGDYPGYFGPGDTHGLARLLERAETAPGFHRELRDWCHRLAHLVNPAHERQLWKSILRELPLGT